MVARVATALHIFAILLLFAACVAALFSLIIGVPGTFIIVGLALVYAWATGFAAVQWSTILWLLLLAVLGEVVEFLAAGVATAGTRPSRRVTIAALAGALVGGIIGIPFLLGLGALIGALAGAFAGAALAVRSEGGTLGESMTTGLAAMKGRLLGFVLKAAIGVTMLAVLAIAML